ncbi:MAG: tetratricopeptide repeat protein, partial [Gammaproteobacteria bacterium]|nr:tetratricopeptide repeat protein [Gammaproteobacteria bacterium]
GRAPGAAPARLSGEERAAAQARAASLLQGGFAREALDICRALLAAEPDDAGLLNLCAVASFHVGDEAGALALLGRAIAAEPEFADAHNNLGNVHKAAGRLLEAEHAYRRAIATAPDHFDGYFNLGIVLDAMGRTREAHEVNARACALEPRYAPAHLNAGNVLKTLGRHDEALAAYRRVLDLEPRHLDAMNNMGTVLYELGRHDEAETTLRRAIELDARHADLHYNLGVVLQEVGRLEEAVECFRAAAAAREHYVEAHVNLGYTLHELGALDAAEAALRVGIGLAPDNAQAHVNLGDLLLDRGEAGAAVALSDEFLARHPAASDVIAFKALALRELGDVAGARRLLDFAGLVTARTLAAPSGYAGLDDFNAALAEHILAHPTLVQAPSSHATRDARHTGELLAEPLGPMAAFERQLRDAVDAYRAALDAPADHPLVANMPAAYRLTVWSVVMHAGGHQIPHIHPSAWLSGVYYVEVPALVHAPGARPAGWIEFGQPPAHFHARAAPELELVEPAAGLLLLFPSYFYHRTIPFDANERRISMAFDVLPERA